MDFDKRDFMFTPPEGGEERQLYFIEMARREVAQRAEEAGRPLTFHITTFGCQMNARDSEKLAGILLAIGYERAKSEDADLVLLNTCSVRENANNRFFGHLGSLSGHKKGDPHRIIALCGCMMQEERVIRRIREQYGFVDLLFGTHNLYQFAELLCRVFAEGGPVVDVWPEAREIVERLPNARNFPFKSGVNIMYGCDNFCSYCIVPYVRGRERSRAPEDILAEIRALADDGVIEVMLLGQNVNSYGKHLSEPVSFAELLSGVARIDALRRIRFLTSHPKDLSDELIAVMQSSDKICRHLHLPLQSGSTRVLAEMNRHYTKEQYLTLLEKLRAAMPDIAITTDLIVGFPGETEEDFEETMDVIRRARFANAFTFLYSPRAGTPAAVREDPVPREVAKRRFERMLREVQEIAAEEAQKLTGEVLDVLVESKNRQEEGLVTGRLANNSVVHLPGDESLIGQIVPVRLAVCRGFYYLGDVV